MGDVCDLGTTDFTISYWVYLTVVASQYIMGKRQGSNDYWFFGTNSGGGPRFLSAVGGTGALDLSVTGGDALSPNTWNHLAASFDRDGLEKIYINGIERASASCAATDIDNTGSLVLGAFGESSNHIDDGYLCNVGIWSRALFQEEIKSIMWKNYANLTSDEKTSLVSWWNLDSTIGESTDTSASTRVNSFVLDNHGYSLGSEMVENFGFEDSSQTSYTTLRATYEYVPGNNGLAVTTTGTIPGDGVAANQYVTIPVSPNVDAAKKYLLSFDIVSTSTTTNAGVIVGGISGTDIHVDKGGTGDHYWYPNTVGSHSSIVTFSSGGTITLSLHAGTAIGSVATFDNLSFKEITGNLGTLS
tara:strand:- start:726 stop:1799 length:1074 start_codon:yes stop_codon:yes gene_type:complete